MKPNSSIVTAEFRVKLKGVLRQHPTPLIKFSQFIELLRLNHIRFYSRDDILRLNKIFPSSKSLQLDYAINFLELIYLQSHQNIKYFVVKTSGRPNKYNISQVKVDQSHSTRQCFQFFRKIMKKKYGNQINWFKVLGGVTISIKIDKDVARVTLSKILKDTPHCDCSERLIKLFSKNQQKYIEWKYFMNLIRREESLQLSPRIPDIPLITRAFSQKGKIKEQTIRIQDTLSTDKKKTRRKTLTFQVTPKACQLYERDEGIPLKSRYHSVKSANQNRRLKKKEMFSLTEKNFRTQGGDSEGILEESKPVDWVRLRSDI